MMITFMISALFLSTTFLLLNHPLSFGLILLIQTFLVAMITGNLCYNFWFSYILFLIMVGGMLILFIYMTSVASNEKFNFSLKITILIPMMVLTMAISMFWDKMFNNSMLLNTELSYTKEMMFSKYINFPNNLIMITMIIYLLITLIMVVKITNIEKGPLRQMF